MTPNQIKIAEIFDEESTYTDQQKVIDNIFDFLDNKFRPTGIEFSKEDVKYAFKLYIEGLTEVLSDNIQCYFHSENY